MKARKAANSGTLREPGERIRVLHLGFEDPQMPGAGGGSIRTHEMNKRIVAQGTDVTVLTTRYRGWTARTQDRVRYIPIGFGSGRTRLSRLLGYCLRLPAEVRKRRAATDLVVEDFFAPFSTMAAPLWTGKPTVGVVQWLHAREKARQYKVPLHWIEYAGVRQHRRMVAVSQATAGQLLRMNPSAQVTVIANGVDRAALEVPLVVGHDVVYLGRLELVGKGLDLLLQAWAEAAKQIDGTLIIAGTGPDERCIRDAVIAAGLSNRVRLSGWITGREKFALLGAARLAVVPSRAETFGMVALESLACGTPVLAFNIPGLREVIAPGCGWLVEPFDVGALAAELVKRYSADADLAAAGLAGRTFAATLNWDDLASLQLNVYRAVLAEPSAPPPAVKRAGKKGQTHEPSHPVRP